MTIKELFETSEDGTLTFEQFESVMKDKGAKFADLSDGKYVSKSKYEADLKAKDNEIETVKTEITTLNETISTRDKDLADLQSQLETAGQQLEAAGQDATKIDELNAQLTGLQSKYEADVQEYQSKMQKQQYEFAVKEFANTKNFTSQAAKRDFIQSMIARGLQMEGDKILGREDFADSYSAENADAFVVETPEPEVTPETEEPKATEKVVVPEFVAPTPGPEPSNGTDTGFHFNFAGVRPHD